MRIMLAVVALFLGIGMAHAKEQRQDCNQRAEGKAGTERNRVIAACIRHNASVSNMPPMLARMTECNRQAGDMTGEARVKFVDGCLKQP
ncbi:MAG: hypothetical protein K0R03_628 [Moraxellaceae bacterium]|nr:hypothetical protein [Moraxellaceae bacterium]MDF3030070.1 hypothetical protein [Moraxellaceae bacterium]